MVSLTLDEVFDLSESALMACGATELNATAVAHSIREAEAEGIRNVGLGFLHYYCSHLLNGAITGDAKPKVIDQSPVIVLVDGDNGFAHPAYDAAESLFYNKAKACGLAALSVKNVYYNGVEGYFVKRMAERGLIGIACTNAASLVALHGGSKPFFGTNPLAFGVPRESQAPLIIDLSTSTTAYVNVEAAAVKGEPIPENWALDNQGNPTSDANKGLGGSLQPLGGAKGTGLALMVEILAAGLAGSSWSFEVPAFTAQMNQPARLGQFYLAIDPKHFDNPNLSSRLEALLAAMLSQEGVRLPGARREEARRTAEREGVTLEDELYRSLQNYTKR